MQFSFIGKGGECGQIVQSINWDEHPLGPINQWSSDLKTSLSIVLNSSFPILLLWGPEYYCFYNDAYRPRLGEHGKHPSAIGAPGAQVWEEIWQPVSEMLDGVMQTQNATQVENMLLPIYRNGKLEDVYWTFSYNPIIDSLGKAVGIFVPVTETTNQMAHMQELNTLNTELEFAINAAELGTWDLDPKTNIVKANARLKKWFGLQPGDDFDLDDAIANIAEKDQKKVQEAINDALIFANGGRFNINYTINSQGTNRFRHVAAKGKCLFDEHGNAIRLNGTLQDITQEVEANNALIRSERKFREIILQAPVGVALLHIDTLEIELVNNSFLNFLGKSRSTLQGNLFYKNFPEFSVPEIDTTFKRIAFNNTPEYLSEFQIHPTVKLKNAVYANLAFEPLHENTETTQKIMLVVTDVSAVVNSKLQIQEAEERLRLATAASGLGSFDWNMQTNQVTGSKRYYEIFGFAGEVNRASVLATIHPDDCQIRDEAHQEALKTGRIQYEIRIIKNQTNEISWISVEGIIYYDINGEAARMLGTILDTTKERNAQQELESINQQLAIAMEAGNIGSYQVDLMTGKATASKQFCFNYGISASSKVSVSDIRDFILPEDKTMAELAIASAMEKHGVYHIEFRIQLPNGEVRWMKESGRVQYDIYNNPLLLIAVSFDITATKALQQQKDEFIGIASHELKTPVTSIKAYTQVLERLLRNKGDLKEAQLMQKMDAQLNRLTNLIADLLDVTKINAGKLQYQHTEFDFNQMVSNVIEEIQRTTETHQIKSNFKTVGTLFADKERLGQVLINLITNALKYSPKAKEIHVHTQEKDGNIEVCVEDFGIGISAQKLERVFEQFYRVSGEMQHTFPGLGLGLYISSEIVKREGGKIWVESVEGKGSRFCFSIPQKAQNEQI